MQEAVVYIGVKVGKRWKKTWKCFLYSKNKSQRNRLRVMHFFIFNDINTFIIYFLLSPFSFNQAKTGGNQLDYSKVRTHFVLSSFVLFF